MVITSATVRSDVKVTLPMSIEHAFVSGCNFNPDFSSNFRCSSSAKTSCKVMFLLGVYFVQYTFVMWLAKFAHLIYMGLEMLQYTISHSHVMVILFLEACMFAYSFEIGFCLCGQL